MSLADRLSIKSKLILMLVAVALVSVTVVNCLGYMVGAEALRDSIFNHRQRLRTDPGRLPVHAPGLLRKKPSTASIVAVGDTQVLALSGEAVHVILERTPSLAREFGEAIGSRLQKTTDTSFDTRSGDTRV